MPFRCQSCGADVVTRVLADSVTLVVVGHCDRHGVQEVSRVYFGDSAPEVYPAEPEPQQLHRAVAYKPGSCCGRRLGDSDSCQLPIGHEDEHAA